MSTNEKMLYSPPEMVRMGDALKLTAGGGDPLSDGYTNPKSYKDAESEPVARPDSSDRPNLSNA